AHRRQSGHIQWSASRESSALFGRSSLLFDNRSPGEEAHAMWYTVRHEDAPIGIVDLPALDLAAGAMQRLPSYANIQPTVRAATAAILELGLFGAAYPPLPWQPRQVLRYRRAIARAARLRLSLVDEQGAAAQVAFVNLLEAPADERVVVVTAFENASASVGATLPTPTRRDRGSA